MKILILGSQGMLGSKLGTVFADTKPTCWDRNQLDITDENAVRTNILNLAPKIIINAAAYTNVDGAETDQKTAYLVNATAVGYIARAAKECGATMVHYSTDYVFSGEKKGGYTEEDIPDTPINSYGASKLAGEQELEKSGARFYLIRTAWLYGQNGKNFVETMLTLGSEKKELTVVNDQWGSPTYTTDLAEFTRKLLLESSKPGIYHAVNHGVTTWFDYAKTIFLLTQMPVTVIPMSSDTLARPAKRPQYSIRQTKGPAMRPWQTALEEYLKMR